MKWNLPVIMIGLGFLFLFFIPLLNWLFYFRNTDIDKKVGSQTESVYFSRISNYDRKRWIAEEHYRRTKYNIKTLSDESYQKLISTPGKSYRLLNDACNYEMLSNEVYAKRFKFLPLPLTQ